MTLVHHPKNFFVHHVGGRKGSRGFPHIKGIEHEIVSVLYDADEECVEHAAAKVSGLNCQSLVLPLCIGEHEIERRLFLTYDPNASSLLEPLTDTGLYAVPDPLPSLDYPLDEALAVVRTVEVPVQRIDRLCESQTVPPPDFLSIDVQGTELDVLKGCGELLRNIVGVLVEVELEPLYRGQALFSEVHEFLRGEDFVLMGISGTPFDPGRTPIGARSRGALISGDALYLRRPGGPRDAALALTALAFGFAGWAAACSPSAPPSSDWERSVAEFHDLVRSDQRQLPPTFAMRYSEEHSRGRFRLAPTPATRTDRPTLKVRRLIPASIRRIVSAPWSEIERRRRQRAKRRSLRQARVTLRDLQSPYRIWGERWGFGEFLAALDARLTSVGSARLIK